jgi:hypothetical protein
MTDVADVVDVNVVDEVRNEVIITVNGRDTRIPMESLELDINSPDRDILNAVRPIIQGREGFDIQDEGGAFSYTVRKAMNSNSIYIYPKPVAGSI